MFLLLASFACIINKSTSPDCIPFDSGAGKHCHARASAQQHPCQQLVILTLDFLVVFSAFFSDLGIIQMSRQGLQYWLTQSSPNPFGWRWERRWFETSLCGSSQILNGLRDVCTYVCFCIDCKDVGGPFEQFYPESISCPFGNDW